MAQRQALGRGLEALIPAAVQEERGIKQIPLDAIRSSAHQPRKVFDDNKLKELSASIRSHGVLAPIILRQTQDGYELVAGERRFRAARMAGIPSIPAIIKEVSDGEMLELALIENVQREDLNPIEEADVYRRLTEEFGLSQDEVARRVGRDRSSVANALRLLRLPTRIQDDLKAGTLTAGHARALLALEAASEQLRLREQIVRRGLTVRAAEGLVRRLKAQPITTRVAAGRLSPSLRALEDRLRQQLMTKVAIVPAGRGGRIELHYFSDEDLTRLVEAIAGGPSA
ncbi:MAG: ParB/RepB/Spo0J family partition protein [candidate division NC10 bacterium]|nr:ParB/RepB/Spo0J family partition protein [candidate division NC10 bacterium]